MRSCFFVVCTVHQTSSDAEMHIVNKAFFLVCACLQLRNFTIEGKNPAFTVAYMVSDLTDVSILMIL